MFNLKVPLLQPTSSNNSLIYLQNDVVKNDTILTL